MRLDGFLFTFKRGTDVLLQLEGALQEFRITEYADACKKKRLVWAENETSSNENGKNA